MGSANLLFIIRNCFTYDDTCTTRQGPADRVSALSGGPQLSSRVEHRLSLLGFPLSSVLPGKVVLVYQSEDFFPLYFISLFILHPVTERYRAQSELLKMSLKKIY
jgi:hypothetical protein